MNTPLRILALNWRCLRHPQVGGSELNLFEQARRWVKDGHEVTVLTADPGREHAAEPEEVIDGIRVIRMGGRFSVYLFVAFFLLRFGARYDRILDVANGIPFFTPFFTRTPSVLLVHHVHDKQWYTEFGRVIGSVGRFLECRFVPWLYQNHPVIAVSPTTRDALVETGFEFANISIVYNGIEQPAELAAQDAPAQCTVAYLGRIKRYKRIDLLVRAVAELRQEFPNVRLELAGDGDARPEVEALVKQLGLEQNVTIHGFVDDATKARILQQATVFATPSMHEGWGLSVIEANVYGCPAVAYDVPGLRVAIRHENTGLLTADDAGFRAAMATLLRDQRLRAELSEGARKWAARFSWETSAAATLALLASGANDQTAYATA